MHLKATARNVSVCEPHVVFLISVHVVETTSSSMLLPQLCLLAYSIALQQPEQTTVPSTTCDIYPRTLFFTELTENLILFASLET